MRSAVMTIRRSTATGCCLAISSKIEVSMSAKVAFTSSSRDMTLSASARSASRSEVVAREIAERTRRVISTSLSVSASSSSWYASRMPSPYDPVDERTPTAR